MSATDEFGTTADDIHPLVRRAPRLAFLRLPGLLRLLGELRFALAILLWSPIILLGLSLDLWDWVTGREDDDTNELRPWS